MATSRTYRSQGLLVLALSSLTPLPHSQGAERGSEVLYIDTEKGFLVADPMPSDVRPGDPLCVIAESVGLMDCSARTEDHSSQRLVFLGTDALQRLNVGDRLILKRVYLKIESEPVPPQNFRSQIIRDQNQKQTQTAIGQSLRARTFPKGGAPELQQSPPEYATEDFPEIFVPKLKKRRTRAVREPDATLQVTDSIRKIFRKDETPRLVVKEDATTAQRPTELSAPEQQETIEPAPLALEFSISGFQNQALVPLATFDSLRFRTLTVEESSRDRLWRTNQTKLQSQYGSGIQLSLNRNRQYYAALGWRSYRFARLESRTSFDEIDSRFESVARTRLAMEAAHISGGWVWNLSSWLDVSSGLGLDVYENEVKFRVETENTSTGTRELMAVAQSRFQTLALLSQNALKASWGSWGLELSGLVALPVVSRNKVFDGSVNVPDRARYTGDPEKELRDALGHRTSPVAAEIWLGLTYTPKRD